MMKTAVKQQFPDGGDVEIQREKLIRLPLGDQNGLKSAAHLPVHVPERYVLCVPLAPLLNRSPSPCRGPPWRWNAIHLPLGDQSCSKSFTPGFGHVIWRSPVPSGLTEKIAPR